jgi:hypothetical protein
MFYAFKKMSVIIKRWNKTKKSYIIVQPYAKCLNNHMFMNIGQMYMYYLAT